MLANGVEKQNRELFPVGTSQNIECQISNQNVNFDITWTKNDQQVGNFKTLYCSSAEKENLKIK